MKIILFNGQCRTAKDTSADFLAKKLNTYVFDNWERSSFAGAVKDIFKNAFGVDNNFIEEWKVKSEIPFKFLKNIRQSLQFIGDGFRQIKQDVWIDIALRDETKNLILSDGRYLSEAQKVKEKGGLNVVLYRPNFLNDDPNPSESEIRPVMEWCFNNIRKDGIITNPPDWMKNYDYFLINDGNIEDLYNKIDNLLIPWIVTKYY